MKTILASLSLALVTLFSVVSIIVGSGIMVHSIYTSSPRLMEGFQIFCFGLIVFLLTTTAFIVSKILTGTEVLIDVMTDYLNREIENKSKNTNNSIKDLLEGLGGSNGTTTIKIGKIDEDGNVTPMSENELGLSEDFLKHRNEFLANAFSLPIDDLFSKPFDSKKTLEQMTIEELEAEEKKAVEKQNFELAAAIISLIEEKKKNK